MLSRCLHLWGVGSMHVVVLSLQLYVLAFDPHLLHLFGGELLRPLKKNPTLTASFMHVFTNFLWSSCHSNVYVTARLLTVDPFVNRSTGL